VRNVADGKAPSRREWLGALDAGSRCREEGPLNPKEGVLRFSDLGQTGDGRTVKRSEAYERMNPVCASEQRDGG